METRTVEQVESWDTRSFSDGFAGLRELSDGEFSGAVRAGGAWLFMLNGRIIGVYEGSLDDFEDADGTAYAAPHPSLPLLFSMQEQGGDTQAKYYTNDTPLSEVDSTLTDGKFTGYVELSENVLSGDYYVAYYGGRSMSVAFVGASEQVVTGDEAFERANDEVGIYEVRDVDIEVTDVPEPEGADEPDESASESSGEATDSGPSAGGDPERSAGGDPERSAGAASSGARGATESQETAESASSDVGQAGTGRASAGQSDAGQTGTGRASAGQTGDGRSDAEQTPASQSGTSKSDATGANASPAAESSAGPATETGHDQTAAGRTETGSDERTASAGPEASASDESAASAQSEASAEATPQASESATEPAETSDSASESGGGGAFSEEEEWRESTTIPSLDPDRSEGPADAGSAGDQRASAASGERDTQSTSATGGSQSRETATQQSSGRSPGQSAGQSAGQSGGQSAGASGSGARSGASGASESPGDSSGGPASEEAKTKIRELRSQLEQRKQQVQQLRDRLSNVESERNELRRERDALRQEVERLEAKLETASSSDSGVAGRQLNRAQAFDGTNLFVRYESKGEATLEEAAEEDADPEDVNANLQLEHHTQFDSENVSVDGDPFEEFLTDSFEYRFVSWVVEELLYEIRDTGHRTGLSDLYEAIPAIDRVDLHGSVNAGAGEDDTREESFDIIMRDRMGNPLVVADLNGDRDPTTGEMMGSLVDAASGVAEAHDELSGAFQVTESFFEPEALETAEEATSGGFLSREKRESFVKLSRKRGYHLCLVESRSGGFHLNVPEL